MTVQDHTSLEDLVGEHDLPLCRLSDEQLQALWAAERLEVDPNSTELIAAGIRALVAADLAEIDLAGNLTLGEHAALIRNVKSATLTSLVWERNNDLRHPVRSWSLLASDLLLEQVYEHPGIHVFTMRRLRRALREILSEIVPAAAGSTDTETTSTESADGEADSTTLPEGLTEITRVRVLQVDPHEGPMEVTFRQFDLALASDGHERCVLLTPRDDSSTIMVDVSRRAVYDHLLSLLVEAVTTLEDDQSKSI